MMQPVCCLLLAWLVGPLYVFLYIHWVAERSVLYLAGTYVLVYLLVRCIYESLAEFVFDIYSVGSLLSCSIWFSFMKLLTFVLQFSLLIITIASVLSAFSTVKLLSLRIFFIWFMLCWYLLWSVLCLLVVIICLIV